MLRQQAQSTMLQVQTAVDGINVSFLMDDYKDTAPAVLWESVEMLRKLLLCVISAFWSTKSVMCVATALLIAVSFQLLHEHYLPYKSLACNRLQSASLAIMSLIYFIGVLLKSQSIDSADQEPSRYPAVHFHDGSYCETH